jgi:predicted kinase
VYQLCLYILCGLPFAGKSSLARALAKAVSAAYVELDAINGERGLGLDGKRISSLDWDETYRIAYQRIDGFLREERPVVYDSASFTRTQRDEVRTIAKKYGVLSKVIYVEVPENIIKERLLQNRKTRLRYDVRDDDFAHVLDNFQPPEDDEHVVCYDQTVPVGAWIKHNFA